MTDEQFESEFRSCEFDPHQFDHRAHLRLAYIHINKYGLEEAINNLRLQISVFDRTHDEGIRYHETITVVAARVLNHFMEQQVGNSFEDLIAEFPKLITDFKSLINQHYSFDLFSHPTAKIEFIEPDLQSF